MPLPHPTPSAGSPSGGAIGTEPHNEQNEGVPEEGAERIVDGTRCGYFGGYWIKLYPVPENTLLEKRRLITTLTRRLFNHVEHGLYVPGERLEEARRAYESETDSARKRVKGGMLAGALFNRAADILNKLVELQAMGIEIAASDPYLRRCGQHLQEALALGTSVRHRTGEEGIDELWGEPFKVFAFPIKDFYLSRYIKLSMMMRCIDQLALGAASSLEACPGMSGVGTRILALAEAAKHYAQSLRSDPEVFDSWSTLAVAREQLLNFPAQMPKKSLTQARELAVEGEELTREVAELIFHIARARVAMPKSASALRLRCHALSERAQLIPAGGADTLGGKRNPTPARH